VFGVTPLELPDSGLLRALSKPIGGILSDDLEHPISGRAA
jgi:hypothetical protein